MPPLSSGQNQIIHIPLKMSQKIQCTSFFCPFHYFWLMQVQFTPFRPPLSLVLPYICTDQFLLHDDLMQMKQTTKEMTYYNTLWLKLQRANFTWTITSNSSLLSNSCCNSSSLFWNSSYMKVKNVYSKLRVEVKEQSRWRRNIIMVLKVHVRKTLKEKVTPETVYFWKSPIKR